MTSVLKWTIAGLSVFYVTYSTTVLLAVRRRVVRADATGLVPGPSEEGE